MPNYIQPIKTLYLKKDATYVTASNTSQYLSVFEAMQPNSIANGEFGFNKEGLLVLKNNTSSLYTVLSDLLTALTTLSTALLANPTSEPAALTAGTALAASLVTLQSEIDLLIAAPGTEDS